MKDVINKNLNLNIRVVVTKVLAMTNDQRATSQAIAHSLDQVKEEALQLRALICEELVMVVDNCDLSALNQVV